MGVERISPHYNMKDKAAVSLGTKGGRKTKEIYGKDYFSDISNSRKVKKGWPKGKKRKV